MRVKQSFKSLLTLLLPLIFIPVTTAQSIPLPPRPTANLTQCILDIRNHTLSYDPFLVAPGGQQTSNPLEAIGTDYNTCTIYCGDSPGGFIWGTFSPQFQGWLLPFLAMLAQLPYESDGTWHDFMSLALTVGSPLLAMYSLALTTLNSRYLKQRLDEAFPGDDIRLKDLKENIFHTLKLSQQEPFQLGSLAAYPTELEGGKLKDVERHWWGEAQQAISSKGRCFTASLATQVVSFMIAFAFTWVDAFTVNYNATRTTAFGLVIALCWSRVVVIVLFWYFAGVSISNRPISEAIKQASRLQRNSLPRLARFKAPKEREYVALSRRIAGDVERAGALYNYAKAFIWTYNVDHLVETLQSHILGNPTVTDNSSTSSARVTEDTSPTSISRAAGADAPSIAASSNPPLPEIVPRSEDKSSYRYYQPNFSEKHAWKHLVLQRMFWSAISAAVLNVATVGAAFWIDFLTGVVGLGCRSGGILIYWMISCTIWILLVVSAWISSHWSVRAATQRIEKNRLPNNLYLLGVVAVALRLVGKGLAILNSAWIVMHCLFELSGFYNRCFCITNRGTAPWLWPDDSVTEGLSSIQERWAGLAVLTGVVCTGYIAFIELWTRTRLQ